MKVFMTGGTGFIGRNLTRILIQNGYRVTVATRNPDRHSTTDPELRFVPLRENLTAEVDGSDIVINLAGETLFGKRWSRKVKKKLYDSRILTTRSLVTAMKQSKKRPVLFLSGSAVGYYGDCGNETITEERGPGRDFLARTCSDWEMEAQKASDLGIRVVNPRTGVTLGSDAVAMKFMLPVFKAFLGGSLGPGTQYFPWIHISDLCRSMMFAIQNEAITGPFNAAAPDQVTMDDFVTTLGGVLSRPAFFKVPEFGLKAVLGEASILMTASLKTEPKKISDQGFTFVHGNLRPALQNLLH